MKVFIYLCLTKSMEKSGTSSGVDFCNKIMLPEKFETEVILFFLFFLIGFIFFIRDYWQDVGLVL